jgi:hypothetical protein
MDALGGTFSAASITKWGIQLAGFDDKLPPPSIGVTILIPSNKAWLKLFWDEKLFVPVLTTIKDKLVAIMSYHISLTPLSPDEIRSSTKDAPKEAPSVFGLLMGRNEPIIYWNDLDVGLDKMLFKSQHKSQISGANALHVREICGSYVYVVDRVLTPAPGLGNVPKVEIPAGFDMSALGGGDGGGGGGGGGGGEEEEVPPSDPLVLQEGEGGGETSPDNNNSNIRCDKTWIDVAKENNLSLLSTVLGQGDVATLLPPPGSDYAILAPVDAAFFTLLSQLGISISDALGLKSKLAGLLLYHALPGRQINLAEETRTEVPTALGQATNDEAGYTVNLEKGEDSSSSSSSMHPILRGMFPDNIAKISKEIEVCGSKMYIIDAVLVPGTSVDDLPEITSFNAPGSGGGNTADAVPSPSPSSLEEGHGNGGGVFGKILKIEATSVGGRYTNCTALALKSSPTPTPATATSTDIDGSKYMFAGVGVTDEQGSSIIDCRLVRWWEFNDCGAAERVYLIISGDSDSDNSTSSTSSSTCVDSWSGLPLPFTMLSVRAPVVVGTDTDTDTDTDNDTSAVVPVILSPVVTLASVVSRRSNNNADVDSNDDDENTTISSGEMLASMMGMTVEESSQGFSVKVANSQLIVTITAGAAAVCGLSNNNNNVNATITQCHAAVFEALAQDMSGGNDGEGDGEGVTILDDASYVGSLLNGALSVVVAADNGDSDSITTTSSQESKAVIDLASVPISIMNAFTLQVLRAQLERGPDSIPQMTELVAKVAAVGQSSLAPAVRKLARGEMAGSEFEEMFSQKNLAALISEFAPAV